MTAPAWIRERKKAEEAKGKTVIAIVTPDPDDGRGPHIPTLWAGIRDTLQDNPKAVVILQHESWIKGFPYEDVELEKTNGGLVVTKCAKQEGRAAL